MACNCSCVVGGDCAGLGVLHISGTLGSNLLPLVSIVKMIYVENEHIGL